MVSKDILEHSIGKLFREKKQQFQICNESLANLDQLTEKKAVQKIQKSLQKYRDWLFQLAICDPACGKGILLNQTVDVLMYEHQWIHDLQSKFEEIEIDLLEIEKHILERNIYGVDSHEENAEATRDFLGSRSNPGMLNRMIFQKTIKCGNLSIEVDSIEKEQVFSWEKEFPQVFIEKNKYAYHITTAIHDSRTSDRMIKYKARERRFYGTKPEAEVFPMSKDIEELIAKTVAGIVPEENLNLAAFNLCRDHMHILLVCEESEVARVMHKIKGRTARACNVYKGINPLDAIHKDGSTPFWAQKFGCKPISSEEQFWHSVNYIERNRAKHNLLNNPMLKAIISTFVKSYEACFAIEYKGGFDLILNRELFAEK